MRVEDVYGYIAAMAEKGKKELTQKEIADAMNGSIGTVNYALKPLVGIGAITKRRRGFLLMAPMKFLTYWAVKHKIRALYSTHYPGTAEEIEGAMPEVIFSAYSGAKFYYGINPSDYGEVYVYGNCSEVEKRFPPGKGRENVFCLEMPEYLKNMEKAPLSLLYADFFNIPTWYATEFFREVGVKLHEILE